MELTLNLTAIRENLKRQHEARTQKVVVPDWQLKPEGDPELPDDGLPEDQEEEDDDD